MVETLNDFLKNKTHHGKLSTIHERNRGAEEFRKSKLSEYMLGTQEATTLKSTAVQMVLNKYRLFLLWQFISDDNQETT